MKEPCVLRSLLLFNSSFWVIFVLLSFNFLILSCLIWHRNSNYVYRFVYNKEWLTYLIFLRNCLYKGRSVLSWQLKLANLVWDWIIGVKLDRTYEGSKSTFLLFSMLHFDNLSIKFTFLGFSFFVLLHIPQCTLFFIRLLHNVNNLIPIKKSIKLNNNLIIWWILQNFIRFLIFEKIGLYLWISYACPSHLTYFVIYYIYIVCNRVVYFHKLYLVPWFDCFSYCTLSWHQFWLVLGLDLWNERLSPYGNRLEYRIVSSSVCTCLRFQCLSNYSDIYATHWTYVATRLEKCHYFLKEWYYIWFPGVEYGRYKVNGGLYIVLIVSQLPLPILYMSLGAFLKIICNRLVAKLYFSKIMWIRRQCSGVR